MDMDMDKDISLKLSLQQWYLIKLERDRNNARKEYHLSEKKLYAMALSGAMGEDDLKHWRHLSLCPLCLNRWARFCRAISDIEDAKSYEEKRVVSWGMLEAAAASNSSVEPLRIKSSCGQFFLGIFPQVGNPQQGMITLEVESDAICQFEGHTATVRDYMGRKLLEGSICQGRVARKIEKLSEINLTRWTVTVD